METYEQKLKLAKEALESGSYDKETIEYIFPELKESEDEKARKWIYDFIHNCPNESFEFYGGIGKKAVLAWLEKQKAAETPQWMIDFLNDIRTASINKEGYDDYDGRREYEGKILAIIRWLEGNFIQQKEQKPAEWSEEDETRLTNTLIMLKEYAIHHYSKDDVNKSVDWLENRLKSLRFQSQQDPEAKLTGWAARDSEHNPYLGLGLVLFMGKPIRSSDCWNGAIASQLPWELFPDLKWEDEPMEVEITIRKK